LFSGMAQRNLAAMNEERGSIFLVGMMGAGKTTVGRLLARDLDFEFIDCDRELEARSGVTITTIFELEGEGGFRNREAAMLDELTRHRGVVLATGGGAVLRADNRAHLRQRGLVIYLQASIDELVRRTGSDKTRPLLQAGDVRARIAELLVQREPLYAQTAHLTFHSAASNPRRLVNRIAEAPAVRALVDPPGA
jgi:shikimate kinase